MKRESLSRLGTASQSKIGSASIMSPPTRRATRRGFSLVEILVVLGLLAIISSIATVGYYEYTNTAREQAVEKAIHKIQTAFETCLTFNKNKADGCIKTGKDTGEVEGYTVGDKVKIKWIRQSGERVCFQVHGEIPDRDRERACLEYNEGKRVKRCFQEGTGCPDCQSYPNCDGVAVCCQNCQASACQ